MSEENKQQEVSISSRKFVNVDELENKLLEMSVKQDNLKNGYNTLNLYENQKNFHIGVLDIIFKNIGNINLVKLSCCILNLYIKKNWSMNNLITPEEKLVNKFFISNNNFLVY